MKLPLWPRPSTRAFMREARRTSGYSLFDWLHGYIYARWPYLYIGIGTGEHPLARRAKPIVARLDALIRRRGAQHAGAVSAADGPPVVGFADTYHGKVVTLETATRLVQVDRSVDPG